MMPPSSSSSYYYYSYSCPAPKKRSIEEDATTYHHSRRPHLFFDSSTRPVDRRSRILNIATFSVRWLGCDFFSPNTNTQIYKRPLTVERFPSDGVFCVFLFFVCVVLVLATWATQKCANAQMHK